MMLKLKNIAYNYLQSLDKSMKLAIKDQFMRLFDFSYERLVIEAYQLLPRTRKDQLDKVFTIERVCALVSLVLPKPSDPILYEDDGPFGIDDLLYTSHYLTDLTFLEDENRRIVVNKCFIVDVYNSVIAYGINESILNSNIFDLTLILLFQCDNYISSILIIIRALISSENELLILRGLKLLTLALRLNKHRVEKSFETNAECLDMSEYWWIFNLRNMQPDIHPIKNRIVAWVFKQSAVIYENFQPKSFQITLSKECQSIIYDPEALQENRIEAFIRQLAKDMKPCALVDETFCSVLKTYLMSSVDEDKKLIFLDNIFEHFHKNFKDKWPSPFICIANLVYNCFYCLKNGYCTKPSIERVREIYSSYRSSFPPKDTKRLSCLINKLKDERTIEEQMLLIRILGHNKFMNIIDTITILYESFKNCKKYVDSERFLPEAEIFRATHPIKRIFRNAVESPYYHLQNVDWKLEIVLAKCPFTIFAKHQEYLIYDLIDVLNGEEKDEEVMEALHFALNSITYGEDVNIFA